MNEYQLKQIDKKINGLADELDKLKDGFSNLNNNIKLLNKNVELLQSVCMGLAFGHYELEDAIGLIIQYPKLIKKYKNRLKHQFVPLEQLHQRLYIARHRSCRDVTVEFDTSARSQEYHINKLIEDGFETQAGLVHREYNEKRKNSLFHRHKQRIFQILLGFVGVIVTSIDMFVNFFKMPEVLPKLLLGRYKKYEIALYFKKQYSMFFSHENLNDKQQNTRDIMNQIAKFMQDKQNDPESKTDGDDDFKQQEDDQIQLNKSKLSAMDKIYRFISIFSLSLLIFYFLM